MLRLEREKKKKKNKEKAKRRKETAEFPLGGEPNEGDDACHEQWAKVGQVQKQGVKMHVGLISGTPEIPRKANSRAKS